MYYGGQRNKSSMFLIDNSGFPNYRSLCSGSRLVAHRQGQPSRANNEKAI